MSRPIGICKLCVQKNVLESSHLMPRRLYEYCQAPGFDPIRVTSEMVLPTSRQTQDYLLCKECENILNKGGEGWITPKLATFDKQFPLYDLLIAVPPVFAESDYQVYYASMNPKIDTQKIIRFGMGLFWKAAVHSWKKNEREPRIELGRYSERIRLFLRGDADFPENVVLLPIVAPPAAAFTGFNDPYEGVRDAAGYRSFFFYVPGILFMMFVGKTIPSETKALCIHANRAHPILVSASIAAKGEEMLKKVFLEGRKTRAFVESKRKQL